MSRHIKGGPRGKGRGGDNSSRTSRVTRSTNEEVQRAIEGLKDMPDDELQEFLDDEEFMQGLNVVDAWDGDELGDEYICNRDARERDYRQISRDRSRRNHRGTFHNNRDHRERQKREERRRDDARRDPSKSSKDIERDKMRTKRDTDSKILAEKEKAIKHLLDSDTVVPPGTETEAIETEKQNVDHTDNTIHKNRERRRSLERHRISPTRRRSGDRIRLTSSHRTRSPHLITPERRRSAERHKKAAWERKASIERRERKSSAERHRRRQEERELRIMGRRSRSRERQRSRSQDRFRKRWSRSPVGRRGSPRRRSISKSPNRRRKRSPFINEIARQFRDEALMSTVASNQGFIHQQSVQRIPPPPLMNTPMHGQVQMPPQHYIPHQETLGPPAMSGGPPTLPFNPFEVHPPQGPTMNFEPMSMHPIPQPDYSAAPLPYNAPTNPIQMHPQGHPGFTQVSVRSPQPVPAPSPMEQSMMFNQQHPQQQQQQCHTQMLNSPSPQPDRIHLDSGHHHTYSDQRGGSSVISAAYNGMHKSRRDRLKTPEPPVISDPKVKTASYPFEKTSLSSLLEASVSAKDTGRPVLYPGFKPEILRHCELALCDLPDEDPRLKIKGRFFFDPTKEEPTNDAPITASNSILLQKNRGKSLWEEVTAKIDAEPLKPIIETHPKYCQTELEVENKSTQTEIAVDDFCVQVCPGELQPSPREEKRPIMDRLDWNVRETYDYTPKIREVDDLRWSLSNSSQKRSWNRGMSPSSQEREERLRTPELRPIQDQDSRDYHRGSPIRNREHFSVHRSSKRDFSPHDRFTPDYRRDLDHQDDYHDVRSDHSHGDSPMIVEDHDDDIEIMEPESFQRESSWRGRVKSYGQPNTPHKNRSNRGKHPGGRSFRGRGSTYRGKF